MELERTVQIGQALGTHSCLKFHLSFQGTAALTSPENIQDNKVGGKRRKGRIFLWNTAASEKKEDEFPLNKYTFKCW